MNSKSILCTLLLCSNPAIGQTAWEEGTNAFSSAEFDQAARIFREQVELYPEVFEVHYMLGVSLQKLRRSTEAVDPLVRAHELNPSDAAASLALALVYLDIDAADRALAPLDTINPTDLTGRLRVAFFRIRALARTQTGDDRGALADFALWSKFEPDNPTAHLKYGSLALSLDDTSEALVAFERAVRLAPRDLEILRAQVKAQLRVARLAQSRDTKRSAYGRAADTAASIFAIESSAANALLLASAELNAGRYSQAIESAQRAARLEPNNWEAQYYLGQAYSSNRQFDLAILPLTEAASLADDAANRRRAWRQLGFVHEKLAQFPESIRAYRLAEDHISEERVRDNQQIYQDSRDLSAGISVPIGSAEDRRQLERELRELERSNPSPLATRPNPFLADLLSAMDRDADPCEDFYRYACGGWLDNNPLPDDKPRFARSFTVVRDRNREIVKDILETAARQSSPSTEQEQVGAFYASCLDQQTIEASGTAPLDALFEEIEKVTDRNSLMSVLGRLHRKQIWAFLGHQVVPDFKNPDLNIAFFSQGGLGLPDRDYYVSSDGSKQELLTAYEDHVATMFELLGESREIARHRASEVVALETNLARASRSRAAMRDFEKLYNKIDAAGLQLLTPDLPWQTYFQAIGYPKITDINVATPEFFESLETLVATTEVESIRAYLRWHVVKSTADMLPKAFVDQHFAFFGSALAGQREIEPRWERCVNATSTAFGEAIGRIFVDREFSGDSKSIALEMISDIESAFEDSLPELSWMDDETRRRAVAKMRAIGHKIGYPDHWQDSTAVEIDKQTYLANSLSAREFDFDLEAQKIGKPVDRSEWEMPAHTVNAFYNPLWNQIAFPAGILQPPFFHRDFPAAMRYGAIGAAMGHELTHGFDDSGRKFDAHGRLEEWWEPAVIERFEDRASCIRDLYSSYEVEPGLYLQGDLTLGENIADIGGIKQSFRAFQRWQDRQEQSTQSTPKLTEEQLFFVATAQNWCGHTAPEALRLQVTTNPHSPLQFRVLGPLSNIEAFGRAFSCPVGSRMRPEKTCTVW